jgi:hypothetical protein
MILLVRKAGAPENDDEVVKVIVDVLARWGKTHTGRRSIFLSPIGKQQNFSENIEFRRASSY